MIKADHLIVVARTLLEGIEYVADTLGAAPVVTLDATGNGRPDARLALWRGLYLKITVADPVGTSATPTGKSGRLGIDSTASRLRAAQGPYLAHWVARVERPRQLAQWARQYPRRIPTVHAVDLASRSISTTLGPDGAFPAWRGAGDGLLPTLIQWRDGAMRATATLTPALRPTTAVPLIATMMPDPDAASAMAAGTETGTGAGGPALFDNGIALTSLEGFHPAPELIEDHLRWLGLASVLSVESTPHEPHLIARFETPSGTKTLK